jgi:hypothetical protein
VYECSINVKREKDRKNTQTDRQTERQYKVYEFSINVKGFLFKTSVSCVIYTGRQFSIFFSQFFSKCENGKT